MHLGSIYLISKDFKKSINFYEKLLEMNVTSKNMERFAQFEFEERARKIMNLNISDLVTKIKYVNNVMPYYYFQVADPDGNAIEITGEYVPKEDEFNR